MATTEKTILTTMCYINFVKKKILLFIIIIIYYYIIVIITTTNTGAQVDFIFIIIYTRLR